MHRLPVEEPVEELPFTTRRQNLREVGKGVERELPEPEVRLTWKRERERWAMPRDRGVEDRQAEDRGRVLRGPSVCDPRADVVAEEVEGFGNGGAEGGFQEGANRGGVVAGGRGVGVSEAWGIDCVDSIVRREMGEDFREGVGGFGPAGEEDEGWAASSGVSVDAVGEGGAVPVGIHCDV